MSEWVVAIECERADGTCTSEADEWGFDTESEARAKFESLDPASYYARTAEEVAREPLVVVSLVREGADGWNEVVDRKVSGE